MGRCSCIRCVELLFLANADVSVFLFVDFVSGNGFFANIRCTAVGSLGLSMIYLCRRRGTWLRSRCRDCCLGSRSLRCRGSMRRRPWGCWMRSCCRACGLLLRCRRGSSRLVGRVGVERGGGGRESGRICLGHGYGDTWRGKGT